MRVMVSPSPSAPDRWLALHPKLEIPARKDQAQDERCRIPRQAGAVGKMLISFGVGKSRMKKYDRCRRVLRAKYPLFDLDAAMPRIASRLVLV